MDDLQALKILALRAVLDPKSDPDYSLRHVFRWFSKTFHTPLAQVEEMPLEDILRHYYEDDYEEKTSDEKSMMLLEVEIKKMAETDEEKMLRERKEGFTKTSDDEFHKLIEEREKKRALSKKEPNQPDLTPRPVNKPNKLPEASFRAPELPKEETVKIIHMDQADFEKLLDEDPVKQPPKAPRKIKG
jgi:primosomal protein N'